MSRALDLIPSVHGQCRLSAASATSLLLAPFGGLNLRVSGNLYRLPTVGLTITNAGLAPSTLYYAYAFLSGVTLALELSTTGHTTSPDGVEVKTGDASRTLVGMVYTNGSSQFVDSGADLLVASYFNRRRKLGRAKFTANRSLAASVNVFTEVNTEIRVNFVTWADEPVRQSICGGWTVTGAATGYGYASIDNDNSGQRAWCAHSANTTGSFSSVDERFVSEGYHFGSLTGNCAGGTNALWLGGQNGEVSHVLTTVS